MENAVNSKKKKIFIILGCIVGVIAALVFVALLINIEKLENVTIIQDEASNYSYVLKNHLSKTDDVGLDIRFPSLYYYSDSVVRLDFFAGEHKYLGYEDEIHLYDIKNLNVRMKISDNCSVIKDSSFYTNGGEDKYDFDHNYHCMDGMYKIIYDHDYYNDLGESELLLQSYNDYLDGTILLTGVDGDINISCDVSYDLVGKGSSSLNEFHIRHQKVDFTIKAPEE